MPATLSPSTAASVICIDTGCTLIGGGGPPISLQTHPSSPIPLSSPSFPTTTTTTTTSTPPDYTPSLPPLVLNIYNLATLLLIIFTTSITITTISILFTNTSTMLMTTSIPSITSHPQRRPINTFRPNNKTEGTLIMSP